MQHEEPKLSAVKANFDCAYIAKTPIPYMHAMCSVGYQIPQNAAPVFERIIQRLQHDRGRRIRILDIGASYGVNAALLRYDVDLSDVYAHYAAHSFMADNADEMLAADNRFYSSLRPRLDVEFLGLDASENAIRYALQAKLLDQGLAADLENEAFIFSGRIFDVDLVISTGTVGYVGARTITRALELCREPDRVWLASFVLEIVDFRPIEAMLQARGMKTECLGRSFVQRRFRDEQEYERTAAYAIDVGLSEKRPLPKDNLRSRLFLSRPASAQHTSLEELLEARSE